MSCFQNPAWNAILSTACSSLPLWPFSASISWELISPVKHCSDEQILNDMNNPFLFYFRGDRIKELEDQLDELGLDNKVPTKLQFKGYSNEWLEIHWKETEDIYEFQLLTRQDSVDAISSNSGFEYVYGRRSEGVQLRVEGETFYLVKRNI